MLNEQWKNEYKNSMDRQKPSEQSIQNLLKAAETSVKAKKVHNYRRLIPLAACFLLLAVLIPLSKLIINKDFRANSEVNQKMVPPSQSGDSVFQTGSGQLPQNSTNPVSTNPVTANPTVTPASAPSKEKDYSELYNTLSELKPQTGTRMYAAGSAVTDKGAASAPVAAPAPAAEMTNQSYSDTNIQVAGVQESDIVKTDGKYIYAMSSDKLQIIKTDNGTMTKVSEIMRDVKTDDGKQSSNAFEMYVTSDRLIVLRHSYQYSIMPYPTPTGGAKIAISPYYSKSFVCADIFDISDKASPKLLNSFSQDGSYVSSRMIDGVVYLLSNSYIRGEINKDDPKTFVPQVYQNGTAALIAPGDISISIDPRKSTGSAQFLIISGVDTSGEGKLVSNKSVLGYGNQIYSSKSNLYVAAYSSMDDGNTYSVATKLYRFSQKDGYIDLEAEGVVPGSVLNQFSMDEYNGMFRIVTTVYTYTYTAVTPPTVKPGAPSAGISGSTAGVSVNPSYRSDTQSSEFNCLYVLDSNLNICGKIENLASGERVYSVRFDGDIGYFVTFRQVDPLFAVDLKEPSNPKVLSALKIPGFSQYLHPYSDTLLFGLGRDADATSGRAGYLKLSMFNVSDPKNVTEASKLIIDGLYYSEASYNHKAIIVDSRKNIIAFPADGKYMIYSYTSGNGFKLEASITPESTFKYSYNTRGLYIGDYFYVVSDNGITSYTMNSYKYFSEIKY